MPRISENTTLLTEKAKLSGLEISTETEPILHAPVEQGQQVGMLTVKNGDEILLEIPITAGNSVARLTYWQILSRCLRTAFFSPV